MMNIDILLTITYGEQLFTDPRRIALLKAIHQTGSLSQAAKHIGISYKTAWDSVNSINKLSAKPFFMSTIGGKGGGGTVLSDYALRFIDLYDLLCKMQSNAFNILQNDSIPLNDILKVATKVSLQSSARNQLYGTITAIEVNHIAGFITVLLQDKMTVVNAYITDASIERLHLIVGKEVILLVKAPQIELTNKRNNNLNHYQTIVKNIHQSEHWCELTLVLATGITIHASRPIAEFTQLDIIQDQQLDIYINPENIIITTLV